MWFGGGRLLLSRMPRSKPLLHCAALRCSARNALHSALHSTTVPFLCQRVHCASQWHRVVHRLWSLMVIRDGHLWRRALRVSSKYNKQIVADTREPRGLETAKLHQFGEGSFFIANLKQNMFTIALDI